MGVGVEEAVAVAAGVVAVAAGADGEAVAGADEAALRAPDRRSAPAATRPA